MYDILMFKIYFKFSMLIANNATDFLILTFLKSIEKVLVLSYHSFHIFLDKIYWYNLTNFVLLA